jgi:hypothetical protein
MPIYEPILPYDKWPTRFTVSPAIRVGNLVFLSCTTATDDQGNIVGSGEFAAMSRPANRCKDACRILWSSSGGCLAQDCRLGLAWRSLCRMD